MTQRSNGKRAAFYLRVSTGEQTTGNQRRELEEAAARHGWQIDEDSIFEDPGISGVNGRRKRSGLQRMLKEVNRGRFDIVAAWSVDRLGRSLQDLLETLGELHAKGVDLYLHRQGIDTRTPGGKAMFQMLGVFAEFEREVIRERINAGIARARLKGTKSGAPIGRAPTPPNVVTAIRKTLAKGTGIIKTAKLHGVGVGTVQRVKVAMVRVPRSPRS
jgi:DNA invertase Pin-like site-specific DNA recombinase